MKMVDSQQRALFVFYSRRGHSTCDIRVQDQIRVGPLGSPSCTSILPTHRDDPTRRPCSPCPTAREPPSSYTLHLTMLVFRQTRHPHLLIPTHQRLCLSSSSLSTRGDATVSPPDELRGTYIVVRRSAWHRDQAATRSKLVTDWERGSPGGGGGSWFMVHGLAGWSAGAATVVEVVVLVVCLCPCLWCAVGEAMCWAEGAARVWVLVWVSVSV